MAKPIIIVGGGIAGLCAAIALQKLGVEAIVYERNREPTVDGAGIIIAPNALQALSRLGISEKIMANGYESNGFHILTDQGEFITKMLVPEGYQHLYAIHRSELHRHLLEALKPGTIYWGKKCERVDQDHSGVTIYFGDGSKVEGSLLIAADGIHSPIRKLLFPDTKYRYAGYTCWRGIADLPTSEFTQQKQAFIETWGKKGRFGVVYLRGQQVYWYALVNAKASDSVLASYSLADLYRRFEHYHSPIPYLLKHTQSNRIIHRDVIDIEPMHQFYSHRIAFIGDAAHAITPNMGQGACQAIEDAVILAHCIVDKSDFNEAFSSYNVRRKKRIAAISQQSWTFGKIAQLESPFLLAARNSLMKRIPSSVMKRQAEQLYRFS